MSFNSNQINPSASASQGASDSLKVWIMLALTLIFVLLYAAALVGLLRPLADSAIANRLEPIIFVIIGYYFGRLPAQQNENTLKNEINRQTQKSDAAQQIKEQVMLEREAMEERIKNVTTVLRSQLSTISLEPVNGLDLDTRLPSRNQGSQQSIQTAVEILDS